MGRPTREELDADLWEREAAIAKRGLDWLDLLIKLRRAAEHGVPADELIMVLRQADLDMMHQDVMALTSVLYERFRLGRADLQFREAQSGRGTEGARVRWEGRFTLAKVADELAGKRDALGDPLPPRELWPMLYAWLDEAGLHPNEVGETIEHDEGEIPYESFAGAIRRKRKRMATRS